jgi:hypothetical protein
MTPINLCKKVWSKVYNPHSANPDIEIDRLLSVLTQTLIKEPTNPTQYALAAIAIQGEVQHYNLTLSWTYAPGVLPQEHCDAAETTAREVMTGALNTLIRTEALVLEGTTLKQGPNFSLDEVLA